MPRVVLDHDMYSHVLMISVHNNVTCSIILGSFTDCNGIGFQIGSLVPRTPFTISQECLSVETSSILILSVYTVLPKVTGWEKDSKNKALPKMVNLSSSMDPVRWVWSKGQSAPCVNA